MENNINNLLINSEYKILDIKLKKTKLYEIIFKLCEDNNILIFNENFNISFIKNINYTLKDLNNDFNFILFSNSPKTHAIKLVDIIYNTYSKYVFYTINLNDNEIVITIDNDRIIYFNLLFSNNIDYLSRFNIIKYDKLDNYNSKLLLLSNELILFFITHELYKPSRFINLINDNILFEYKKNNIENITHINNLSYIEKYVILLNNLFNNIKKSKINVDIINRTKNKILSNFINEISDLDISNNIILLDQLAINILSKEELNYNNTLNFIIQNNSTSNNFNNIQYIIEILKDILKKNKINYTNIAYNKSNLYFYNDFRLKKTTIFIISDDNKKLTLMNVYNSIDFELIPIIQRYKNFNIPHEFVIVRFILLNLITSQAYDNYFNKDIYTSYINNIYKLYKLDIIYEKIFYKGIYKDEKHDKFALGSYVVRPLQEELKQKTQ
jgi:hypothetical protein